MGTALVSLYYSSGQDLFEFPAVLKGCIIVLGLNHPIHGEHSLISEQCQQLTNTIYMQVSNVGIKDVIEIGYMKSIRCIRE
jgi:hypothetical protein